MVGSVSNLDERGRLIARTMRRVESAVWCDTHGEVHENSTDPYGEGAETCFGDQRYWANGDHPHRSLFVSLKRGDYVSEEY